MRSNSISSHQSFPDVGNGPATRVRVNTGPTGEEFNAIPPGGSAVRPGAPTRTQRVLACMGGYALPAVTTFAGGFAAVAGAHYGLSQHPVAGKILGDVAVAGAGAGGALLGNAVSYIPKVKEWRRKALPGSVSPKVGKAIWETAASLLPAAAVTGALHNHFRLHPPQPVSPVATYCQREQCLGQGIGDVIGSSPALEEALVYTSAAAGAAVLGFGAAKATEWGVNRLRGRAAPEQSPA
jgi:hypothetical protein